MRRSNLADALFPRTRQQILAATVLNPGRWWYLTDLARHLGVTPSTLQRELDSLVQGGILVQRREGRQVYFAPDPQCPILSELQGIMSKTAGLADVLRRVLTPLMDRMKCAFVYGSVAREEEGPASDVDLMVIGEVALSDVAVALREAETELDRPINPSVYTPSEFAKKRIEGNHFLTSVVQSEKLFILGSEDELAAA